MIKCKCDVRGLALKGHTEIFFAWIIDWWPITWMFFIHNLTYNFLRGHIWVYERSLKANSPQNKVLGRSQHVLSCSSYDFLVNGDDPIPTWDDSCSPKIFKVKNELSTHFLDILLYLKFLIILMNFFFHFLWTLLFTSKCIYILNMMLKFRTISLLHVFLTISWSLMILVRLETSHKELVNMATLLIWS